MQAVHREPICTVPSQFEESHEQGDQLSQSGQSSARVLAVFVINFDTRKGNVLEWCLPEGVDLSGVEFRAMISGAHSVESDFVYFRHQQAYGVAVCASRETTDQAERHFRIKSVGILCTSALHLHRFRDFLETQARAQLCHQGNYDALKAFYEDGRHLRLTSRSGSLSLLEKYATPAAPLHEPPNCFDNFVHYFGPDIMILWKLMLLRRRILFYSPPPIGHVCYKVYCTFLLQTESDLLPLSRQSPLRVQDISLGVSPETGDQNTSSEALFYVNVADIPWLEANRSRHQSTGFVACTTERIFASKPHLYDVLIDVTKFQTNDAELQPVLKVNSQDKLRFEQLVNASGSQQFCDDAEVDNTGRIFVGFFRRQNTRVFHFLGDVSSPHSEDHIIRPENLQLLSLEPKDDKTFMALLLRHRHIDAILATDACC